VEEKQMQRDEEIRSRLQAQRQIWVETVKSAADRLSNLIGPSSYDVAWLASLVGQLATQESQYAELRGQLRQETSKAQAADASRHLQGERKAIAEIILKVMGETDSSCNCECFVSPEEWAKRQERFANNALLVLIHDGNDLSKFCNYDYMQYELIAKMDAALKEHGYYIENCTTWYSGVYSTR
jgi:hypothetical protein